jgi:cellulose synthase/poly-beta-1,6-N-acetylglucosamine synthase-like glycosyltransferase
MTAAVWSLIALIAFVYLGYPVLIALVALIRRRRPRSDSDRLPSLALLIPAHNEATVIAAKLANALESDYPPDRLRVYVISDASDDGTDGVVAGVDDPRVRLIRQERREGKVNALKRGIAAAGDAEIICFSDANSRYEPDALRRLAAVFSDPRVGAACGRLRLSGTGESGTAAGEGLYWRYEDAIKAAESLSGTMLMGAGTIYAARRELIPDVPAHRADDSIVPLAIAVGGYQVAWVPGAVAWERTAVDAGEEFRRKVRMIAHDFGGYFHLGGCWRRPSVGLRLFCHKLLRWLVPLFYLAALGLAVPSALGGDTAMLVAALVLGGGLVWGGAAWGAMALGWRPKSAPGRLLALPGHFVMVNAAALFGICRSIFRGSQAAWEAVPSSHGGLADDGASRPR